MSTVHGQMVPWRRVGDVETCLAPWEGGLLDTCLGYSSQKRQQGIVQKLATRISNLLYSSIFSVLIICQGPTF